MKADVMQIKMFEIVERSKMEKHQNGNDFALRHFIGAISAPFALFVQFLAFLQFFCKFFAEIICNA
jgi:hypothetical protein